MVPTNEGDVGLPAVTHHATVQLATSRGGRFARHRKHCSVAGARVVMQPVVCVQTSPKSPRGILLNNEAFLPGALAGEGGRRHAVLLLVALKHIGRVCC
jgi:hypothetical protein